MKTLFNTNSVITSLRILLWIAPILLTLLITYNNPHVTLQKNDVDLYWGISEKPKDESFQLHQIFYDSLVHTDRQFYVFQLGVQPIGVQLHKNFNDWKTLSRLINNLPKGTVKLFIYTSQVDDRELAKLITTGRVYSVIFTKPIAVKDVYYSLQAMHTTESFQQLAILGKDILLSDNDVRFISSLSIKSIYIAK